VCASWSKAGKSDLVISGLYRFVRHPLYLSFVPLVFLQYINTFIVYMALTVYILVGVIFEERKLLREFGQKYANYRSVTPMLIPGLSKTIAKRRVSAGKWGGNK
jgi:protein-S-isoprenylcysteine O-methyltransferase Ste14